MFKWFHRLFDPEVKRAASSAIAWFRANDLGISVATTLLAIEENRWIFRIVYRPHNIMCRPLPYVVVAVARSSLSVANVSLEDEPEFRIRDYK